VGCAAEGDEMSLADVSGITVIDVMRELHVEITDELSWRVGAAVRQIWVTQAGTLPDKVLRRKTNKRQLGDQNGKHLFAAYPESYRPIIARIIGQFERESARQGRFDFPAPERGR
jgi:hypothetical protein